MATNFPESLDNITNPNSSDSLSNPSHSQQHINANDAIESLQIKVGIDGSQDTNSLDYKVSNIEDILLEMGGSTSSATALLGAEGNNDLLVTGIENKTTIDTFDSDIWGTIKYTIQISNNNEYYSSEMFIIEDGSSISVSESNIVSNTSTNLATVGFERNGSIISLTITPLLPSINARFYRTALKK
jgi:hypothetical protein